jgi:hypothetical protein
MIRSAPTIEAYLDLSYLMDQCVKVHFDGIISAMIKAGVDKALIQHMFDPSKVITDQVKFLLPGANLAIDKILYFQTTIIQLQLFIYDISGSLTQA